MLMLAKILVTVFSVIIIVFVNWYFFFSRRKTKAALAAPAEGNVQEVKITVKGGYSPDVIVVKKGMPVRLNFYREETADCSDTVVFGDFNIRQPLPAFKTTVVEFTPREAGDYTFTCGMGMLKGKLIVR
jgi:plastocyanin domain-containing protein